MRNNLWLEKKLDAIWQSHFSDVKRLNGVRIFFGKKAKKRLASIRQKSFNDKNSDTEIRITSYYKDLRVPEFVIDATIAHELCHYTHGFASPYPQFFKHPHKGDIVDKELINRDLGETLAKQEEWLKKNWAKIAYYDGNRRKKTSKTKKPILLNFLNRIFSISQDIVYERGHLYFLQNHQSGNPRNARLRRH